jgi:hypothetical protein
MDFRRRWGIKPDGNSHRMRNAHRKIDFERPDLENVASDLISGQYDNPVCIVAVIT